jgi:hypothetical protein
VLTYNLCFRPLLGRKGSAIFESINGCLLLHWNPSIDGMPVCSPFSCRELLVGDHMNLSATSIKKREQESEQSIIRM